MKEVQSLVVDDNPNLATLSMPRLASVRKLELADNEQLSDLSGLAGLVRAGEINIRNSSAFTDLHDLSGLKKVSSVIIFSNDGLVSLSGLEHIERLYSLVVWQNETLQSLAGLDNLRSVSTLLDISDNYSLIDVTGLHSLEYVGLNFYIVQNATLKSLGGLENFHHLGAEANAYEFMDAYFAVYKNRSLPTCEAHRILSGVTFDVPEYHEVCIYDNRPDSCEEIPCDEF